MLAYGALRYAQKTGQSMPVYAKLDQTIKNWETKHNLKSALEPQPMRAPPPEHMNLEGETTSSGLPWPLLLLQQTWRRRQGKAHANRRGRTRQI